jgi:PAS domain S-box-containing protein
VSDAINNLRERIPEERTRLLEALVESTSDAIIGLDAEHNVVSWNAGAQSMLGYKAEEIVGRSASALVAPERRDRAQENREYLARGGTLSNYETELLRKDGQRVHVSLSSSHLKDEAGVSIGYVTVARDLTESKRAEEALRDTENKLLALYESGVVGVAMGEGDLILNANDALLEMLGYEREELESEGLNWRKITPTEDLYRDELVLRHALRHGYIEPFEKEYVRKDERRVPVIVGGRYYAGIRPGSSASSSISPSANGPSGPYARARRATVRSSRRRPPSCGEPPGTARYWTRPCGRSSQVRRKTSTEV